MTSAGSAAGGRCSDIVDRPALHSLRTLLVCAILTVAVLGAFGQVLDHEFVNYDDDVYVTENRHVQQGLTREGLAWAFSTVHAGNWHPVTWLSHMLDIELHGLRPRGHHATNLVLHVVNTLLLLLFFRHTTGRTWPSIFVAGVFALHPLRVESVAWIAERKDVLCGFFWILSLWAYVHYATRPAAGRYVLLLIIFTAGLLTKPMIVTLPAVLLLLDYWPLRRIRRAVASDLPGDQAAGAMSRPRLAQQTLTYLVWEKTPLAMLVAAGSVVTVYAQRSAKYLQPLDVLPLDVRLANAPLAYLSYIGKLFWPQNLAVPYPHPGTDIGPGLAAVAALGLAAATVLAIHSSRNHPYFIVGWLWFLGTLLPTIGLVQVGPQSMADRYTYLPLIGLSIALAWAIPALWPARLRKVPLFVLGTAIILALIATTREQVKHWKNSSSLWERALAVTKDNYIAHANLGRVYLSQGDLEVAAQHLTASLAIRHHPNVVNNLGVVRFRQGRFQEAIALHLQALKDQPDFAEAHGNLGNLLISEGRVEEGIRHWEEVLKLQPDNVRVRYNLGVLRYRQGRFEEAIGYFTEALRFRPGFVEAQVQLDRALQRTRD